MSTKGLAIVKNLRTMTNEHDLPSRIGVIRRMQ